MKKKNKHASIYLGPMIPQLGLQYGALFKHGIIHPSFDRAIKDCRALGELFVPVTECAIIRRELNFDLARNMRGTTGKYVALYHEVEKWLANQVKQKKEPSTGVTITQHA